MDIVLKSVGFNTVQNYILYILYVPNIVNNASIFKNVFVLTSFRIKPFQKICETSQYSANFRSSYKTGKEEWKVEVKP